ncbi:hypothetical protein GGR51DRAFT_511862 [Nemania sp. FL0031]|nr:hypothetical protein GGR51DRAFT_511862 [Nemania sp. FL0031]
MLSLACMVYVPIVLQRSPLSMCVELRVEVCAVYGPLRSNPIIVLLLQSGWFPLSSCLHTYLTELQLKPAETMPGKTLPTYVVSSG